MKKLLISLTAMFMLSVPVFADRTTTTVDPICVQWNNDAMQLYIVGGATTSAATFTVFADSISFTTADGLYPGTTEYVFAEAYIDTVGELIAFLNAVPANTPGAEGGIVASLPNGSYDGNITSSFTAVADQNILGAENIKTLDTDATLGISYIFPTTMFGDSWEQLHITGMNANATYAAGSVEVKVYDGALTTNTCLLRYKLNATTLETPILSIPSDGTFAGSPFTSVRVDMVGSSPITAGYLNIIGYKK